MFYEMQVYVKHRCIFLNLSTVPTYISWKQKKKAAVFKLNSYQFNNSIWFQ